MPAYDSSNCSRECTGLNTVFSNAAMLAESGMSLPEILRMISNQTAIRLEGRDDHKVFANGVDAYAGTLVDKLEAGTGIAIAAAVPTGAKGRAALERVVTITATGATSATNHAFLSSTHTDTTAASGTTGDLIQYDGSWKRLGVGSTDQILTVDGGKPKWKDKTESIGTVPIGAMMAYGGSSAPANWLKCDGSSKDTTTYAALFAVIGYTYGGSGANFTLPDKRGRVSVGKTTSGTFGTAGAHVGVENAILGHYHTGANQVSGGILTTGGVSDSGAAVWMGSGTAGIDYPGTLGGTADTISKIQPTEVDPMWIIRYQ